MKKTNIYILNNSYCALCEKRIEKKEELAFIIIYDYVRSCHEKCLK